MEWSVTILFLLEYIIRLYASPRPTVYIKSFFGVVDFICILPSFASLILANSHYFIVFRLLRVMRVFRLFRLGRFLAESDRLLAALKMSVRRVILFVLIELILTIIFGSIMYIIEEQTGIRERKSS
jgi:voltage-gated potassium channel